VYSIVVQNDGKILVGGEFTEIAGYNRTNLARLDSDGQLDTAFPEGTDGAVYRLLKQPDGRILVGGGFTNLQGVLRQKIGRLLTNGTIDLSFDAGNAVPEYMSVLTLACQSDEKVLAVTVPPSGSFSLLTRLHPDGQVDNSFVQTNVFWGSHVFAIRPRTNGSILVGGGFQEVNGFSTPALALISTNGELDTSFTSPLETYSFSSTVSGVYSMTELSDSSVLIGGGFWQQGSSNRLVLAKLTPSLAWNATFQPDAFDPGISNPIFSYVMSVVQQANGKMLIGGNFYEVGGYWRRHILRLDALGHVDPCFDPGVGLGGFDGVKTLALQLDGRVLVGGKFSDEYSYTNLVRLLPQNDCNAIRTYLQKIDGTNYFVAATCPPGGANLFQASSNLVDWITTDTKTAPYFYYQYKFTDAPAAFFRVKKEY
jgi:uncharacterized delta-60 repeat protein